MFPIEYAMVLWGFGFRGIPGPLKKHPPFAGRCSCQKSVVSRSPTTNYGHFWSPMVRKKTYLTSLTRLFQKHRLKIWSTSRDVDMKKRSLLVWGTSNGSSHWKISKWSMSRSWTMCDASIPTLFMAKSQVLTPFWSLNPPSPQFHHVSPKQHAREDHGEQRKALHHHLHYGHGHASAVMSNQQMH